MLGKSYEPSGSRYRGLEPESREIVRDLEGIGFAYVELPPGPAQIGTEKARLLARARGRLRTLQLRFAPIPLHGLVVERDPEGDGPYFMFALGEYPSFE